MPSAFTQNFYHAVFSTRHRENLITPELETRLYPFMGGIVRDLRCALLAINGMPDHVHRKRSTNHRWRRVPTSGQKASRSMLRFERRAAWPSRSASSIRAAAVQPCARPDECGYASARHADT